MAWGEWPISAGDKWMTIDPIQELYDAIAERATVCGYTLTCSDPAVGDKHLWGDGSDPAGWVDIRAMQDDIEAMVPLYAATGASVTPAGFDEQVNTVMAYTLATWRVSASIHADGFARKAQDGTVSHGLVTSGYRSGYVQMWNDMYNGVDALAATFHNPTESTPGDDRRVWSSGSFFTWPNAKTGCEADAPADSHPSNDIGGMWTRGDVVAVTTFGANAVRNQVTGISTAVSKTFIDWYCVSTEPTEYAIAKEYHGGDDGFSENIWNSFATTWAGMGGSSFSEVLGDITGTDPWSESGGWCDSPGPVAPATSGSSIKGHEEDATEVRCVIRWAFTQ